MLPYKHRIHTGLSHNNILICRHNNRNTANHSHNTTKRIIGDIEDKASEQTPATVPIQPLNFIYTKHKKNKTTQKTPKEITMVNKALTVISFNMRSWANNHTAIESYICNNAPPDIWLL